MATWVGVLVIAPLIWFFLFVVFDSLFGDLRATSLGPFGHRNFQPHRTRRQPSPA